MAQKNRADLIDDILKQLNSENLALTTLQHKEQSDIVQKTLMLLFLKFKGDGISAQDFGKLVIMQAIACMGADVETQRFRSN